MQFKPTLDRVLVSKTREGVRRTESGIYLPSTEDNTADTATVVAIGPGQLLWDQKRGEAITIPMRAKVGDVVMVPKFNLTEVELGNRTYLLIKDSEILGFLVD